MKTIGQMLDDARNVKGWSRQQVVDKYYQLSQTKLDQSTLSKYEKGTLNIPARTLKLLVQILEVDPAEAEQQIQLGRGLSIGVNWFPDAIFLRAVGVCAVDPSDKVPDLMPLTVDVGWAGTLSAVALSGSEQGGVDIALYNQNLYKANSAQQPMVTMIEGSEIVEYRGYCVLATPNLCENGDFAWTSFHQYYINNAAKHGERDRIRIALLRTLMQWTSVDGPTVKIFVPKNTDMSQILNEIIDAALDDVEFATVDEKQALEKLSAAVETAQLSERDAFVGFLNSIESVEAGGIERAIFVGGLSHRLLAQECNAIPVIEYSFLKKIASLDPRRLKTLFTPTNVLVVNRAIYHSAREQIDSLRARWNRAVDLISDATRNTEAIGVWFDKQMERSLDELGLTPDQRAKLATKTNGWLSQILQDELIRFLKWS